MPLSSPERRELVRQVMDDIFGLGPIEQLMRDPLVSDILVNGFNTIYIERHGVLTLTDATFRDDEHLRKVIQRVGARVGRRIDESSPMLDARLADGSRVNAIIPPLAVKRPGDDHPPKFGEDRSSRWSPIWSKSRQPSPSNDGRLPRILRARVETQHASSPVVPATGKTTLLNLSVQASSPTTSASC